MQFTINKDNICCPNCGAKERTTKERLYSIQRRLLFFICNNCGQPYRVNNGKIIKMRRRKK